MRKRRERAGGESEAKTLRKRPAGPARTLRAQTLLAPRRAHVRAKGPARGRTRRCGNCARREQGLSDAGRENAHSKGDIANLRLEATRNVIEPPGSRSVGAAAEHLDGLIGKTLKTHGIKPAGQVDKS